MKRFLLILIVCLIPLMACSTPAKHVTFEPITMRGVGTATTPPFTVTTDEWIIEWSYVPDPEYGEHAFFSFQVYPRGKTDLLGYVSSAQASGSTSGSTYCYAGAGEYYINVMFIANIKEWEITISSPD